MGSCIQFRSEVVKIKILSPVIVKYNEPDNLNEDNKQAFTSSWS